MTACKLSGHERLHTHYLRTHLTCKQTADLQQAENAWPTPLHDELIGNIEYTELQRGWSVIDYHLSARAADAHPYCTVHLEPGAGPLSPFECCSNDHTQRKDGNKRHSHEYAMTLQCIALHISLKSYIEAY